ncbi:GFA family protein [Ponticoccus sp. SC2-23]|uniref:GFA family protein n=1 Tax=Alexandriicola marinus TaxID=2081710 RepID=UPI000FDCA697|nr:GFA family protein [Alexandriicola marinus]MBM1219640.1 GFA family protein [Ponticoccus sp. SC6-9]MBM1223288.1 GFA family protein [Ponticoccus sp. SC6-15]MBM1229453.1 GFA family protein [Ponticoccus sp. SC6-38]MBM1232254.1 GFA family protein [Ponticoccus sp. SC6-45]MBM1237796.1 GFA family protein [Ponticoccus sp. SC6-49]MBM1241265.1 GFA family protein [Ponticoccus sp. SC2-64]MBM1245778.1 GFA family protein [Ponticoccus sp. SC6-42]MBM1250256.1 GFA family protein [Ponticoccus sp. SC6-33]M
MSGYRAACACGQLGAEVTGQPLRVAICHCHACRTRTGSAFSWNARFSRDSVSLSGEARAFSRLGDEGGTITYHFCPDCGVTVWYETSGRDGVAIPVGAFAPGQGPKPEDSVYDNRRPDWLFLAPELEVFN